MKMRAAIALFPLLAGLAIGAAAQEVATPIPEVIHHDQPIFPPLARTARIVGDVQIQFTTNGASVVNAVSLKGHPLLSEPAVENVRSWKFAPHDPGTFVVTFRYKMQPEAGDVRFFELHGYYATLGLGRWKAKLKSAKGTSQLNFDLYATGPDSAWLRGTLIDEKGRTEDIDSGDLKDDFMGFIAIVVRPDGERLKVLFAGKRAKDKITGTYVDENGGTGGWTAQRIGDNLPPG
jgi:hypothetical protein